MTTPHDSPSPKQGGNSAAQPAQAVSGGLDSASDHSACAGASEEWRPFREGTYAASSLGRIKRVAPWRGRPGGRVLKDRPTQYGYYRVSLSVGGIITEYLAHRVVSEAFFGPCPAGLQVNHIDGNGQNNALSNLEYVTPRENNLHSFRVLGNVVCNRKAFPIAEIFQGRRAGKTYRELANKYSTSRATIGTILHGLHWQQRGAR